MPSALFITVGKQNTDLATLQSIYHRKGGGEVAAWVLAQFTRKLIEFAWF